MQNLQEEITRELKIIERCNQSLYNGEPYDLNALMQQIYISQCRMAAFQMKVIKFMSDSDDFHSNSGVNYNCNINYTIQQQIISTQILHQGVRKVHCSLANDNRKNKVPLKKVEQVTLELSEKLFLLLRCVEKESNVLSSLPCDSICCQAPSTSMSPQSGTLIIRVTGLEQLPDNTPYNPKSYASKFLLKQLNDRRKGFFRKHYFRKHQDTGNDYIVVLHIGGQESILFGWNEKRTMTEADEETIECHKSRQLEFEVYHTDNRSLCAIGFVPLEYLMGNLSSTDKTVRHFNFRLIPSGRLQCQISCTNNNEILTDRTYRKKSKWIQNWKCRGKRVQNIGRFNSSWSIFRNSRKPKSIGGYQLLDVIGFGTFGTVHLAKRETSDSYVAIKVIEKNSKNKLIETDEIDILKEIFHPFVCPILENYIRNKFLYLVLEFCEGGDLLTHLCRTEKGFDDEQVRFFAACIVLALEYLHGKLLVHRDLKPQNIMITRNGYLKIIDFGLSRRLSSLREKMNEVVGTLAYLAVEIHRREDYGIEMDWWSLGVTVFQLKTKLYHLRENVINNDKRIGLAFRDFIVGLTAYHPEARLGYYGAEDVKKHPFFFDVDFEAIYNMAATPPYIPYLLSGVDLRYFDKRSRLEGFIAN